MVNYKMIKTRPHLNIKEDFDMKKFLALSFAAALTFSTAVCAAETVVPEKDFSRLDTLAVCAEKSLPE